MTSTPQKHFVLVLALAGCNQIYDLKPTGPLEEYFDAPTDAPFACPPAGQTPAYSPLLRQVIQQNCVDYHISPDRQVGSALCLDDLYYLYMVPSIGPIDGPLTPITGLEDTTFDLQFMHMSPDGDLLVTTYYAMGVGYEIRTYDRQNDGSWVRGPNIFTSPSYVQVSAPTRKPRHIMRTSTSDPLLHELVQDGTGAWTEMMSHSPAELGAFPDQPKFSADGLRIVFLDTGTGGLVYTDRPSLGAAFRTAAPLVGIPYVRDAFMTEDCSRVYFSGLQQIMYLQQQ